MNIRQTNLALQTTTVLMSAGAIATLVTGLSLPLETQHPGTVAPVPIRENNAPRLPAVSSFSPLFFRSLQSSSDAGAIVASAPQTLDASAPQPAVAASQLTLVGTIGDSVALIRGPDGTVAMVEQGDDVNGAPVLAIRPSQVDLRIDGKITTLQKAPLPDDNAVIINR